MEPFVVMAKPVGAHCNLECSYCYYATTGSANQNQNEKFRMSDSLLETYIRQYIEASPGPVISFTWHGGEPTLAGIDFYRQVVALQNRYLPQGFCCWNNLQTNGILLNDEWCSFLAEHHFDVGISIDGTEWLNDAFRRDHHDQGTYSRVVEAIKRLQAHGIQPDLLCTVNAETVKEPILVYRTLRELNTGWLQFIPIIRHTESGQVTEDSVTGDDYGRFLCTVFDEWMSHDLGRLEIQQVAEALLAWSGGVVSLCTMSPTCGRVLVVEQDGSVYSCDHFVAPDYRIGDITSSSLAKLVELPVQKQFGRNKIELLPSQCKACSWLSVCNGGCIKDRFILSENGESGLNYLCSGYKQYFSHIENPVRKMIELLNNGFSYDEIKISLQKEELAKWHNIGRNDPCPCGSGRKSKHCCLSNRMM